MGIKNDEMKIKALIILLLIIIIIMMTIYGIHKANFAYVVLGARS